MSRRAALDPRDTADVLDLIYGARDRGSVTSLSTSTIWTSGILHTGSRSWWTGVIGPDSPAKPESNSLRAPRWEVRFYEMAERQKKGGIMKGLTPIFIRKEFLMSPRPEDPDDAFWSADRADRVLGCLVQRDHQNYRIRDRGLFEGCGRQRLITRTWR